MVETTVERGNLRAALLEEADLVEWGEKIVTSTPAAFITSFTQRRNVSLEANLTGGRVVRKNPVSEPLMDLVLSR